MYARIQAYIYAQCDTETRIKQNKRERISRELGNGSSAIICVSYAIAVCGFLYRARRQTKTLRQIDTGRDTDRHTYRHRQTCMYIHTYIHTYINTDTHADRHT